MDLEQKKMSISLEERITVEKLQVEKKKVKAEEKIAVMKEKDKLTVKLPKLDPKKFDGNILKWTEFWDAFKATIHSNKGLHAVKSQLYGNASQAVSGLELTKDNYYVAIDLLKERCGKKQVMVNAHYVKLINLPVATFKSASLRSFYNTTEKHLGYLRSLGQDDNQMQILSMMQSKLPQSVLVKLKEMKPEGEEWTVENFRRLLKRHINAQEAADLQVKLFQKPDESLRPPILSKLYPYDTNKKHSTGESLLSNKRQKPRFARNCIFCDDEQH